MNQIDENVNIQDAYAIYAETLDYALTREYFTRVLNGMSDKDFFEIDRKAWFAKVDWVMTILKAKDKTA
tara:strand:+ start:320 stop:526 length:207 start_codon:yes stop_codon:yes gene_type:complete